MPAVIKDSKIQEAADKDVEYEMISPARLVGANANLVPLSSNAQSPRLFYASRFVEQAMPLETRETPLVQSLDPESEDGKSFEQLFGRRMGTVYFDHDVDGTVEDVNEDFIKVKGADGNTYEHPLYKNFQFNRKTYIHSKPVVRVGDKVTKGQLLAGSNYTDDEGTMAMGVNARVAMVPYKGHSMDDAIVVSESFANKLRSMHNYQHELQKDDQNKFGKVHYASLFPTKFTTDQLDTLDDNGMVKPGTVLHKGDPIMLATKPKPIYSNAEHLGRLGKIFRSVRADAAEVWEHDYPGVVTDSVEGKKGYKVFVQAESPAKVGDKMTIRNGNKCYHPDTEVFTEKGWKKIGEITTEDKVAALFDRNVGKTSKEFGVARSEAIPQDFYAKFVHPVATTSYQFDGELYCFENTSAAYAVTGNHRIWTKCVRAKRFRASSAEDIHGHLRLFMDTSLYDLGDRTAPEYIELAHQGYDKKGRPSATATNHSRYKTAPFVKFLAFYLCEGNIKSGVDYGIIITQKERPFCREVERVLDELGLVWKRYNDQYRIGPDKTLSMYLRQFGHAADKYIPEWVFHLPKDLLQTFVDWAWQGDGGKHSGNKFYSSSFKMIEGIQRILIMLGHRTRWTVREKRAHQNYDSYTLTRYSTNLNIFSKACNPFRGRDPEPGYYKLPYSGPVYCCQVPGLGVVLTRYHGKIMWNGNSIISLILPDRQMLRSVDGQPFDVLLNPLALPSRVNTATLYEMMVGKVAKKQGKPIAMPAYVKPGESRLETIKKMLKDNDLTDTEEVFDPMMNRKLENPVATGIVYVNKLHHVVDSKKSARGNAGYDSTHQPLKGGSDAAQAKRLGGLETTALMAKGAYEVLRDSATVRGTSNDSYWRAIRQGYKPAEPGAPYAWEKFRYLLNGAGFNIHDLGKGVLRLSPMTDKDLDEKNPMEVQNGKLVKPDTLEPEEGGLFDSRMVALNKWGKITLPHALPNPAVEAQIATLLRVKVKDLRRVLAGEVDLEDVQAKS